MTQSTPTLAARIDELKEASAGRLPSEVSAAFGADLAKLQADGIPAGAAGPGTKLPDAELLDVEGNPTSLTAIQAGRSAVIVLYRGAWCPYCNLTLGAYQRELLPGLTRRGVALVAISPQRPDGSLSMQQKQELTFDVASDPGNQIAKALGVTTSSSDDVRQAQGSLGLDLAEVNADGTYELPMPTVAVIDAAGVVKWIDVHPDYTTRTEPAAVFAGLDLLS